MAFWLAARCSVAARQVSQCQSQEGWRLLREFCANVLVLGRGDHRACRLRLHCQQLEFCRQRQHDKRKPSRSRCPARFGPARQLLRSKEDWSFPLLVP